MTFATFGKGHVEDADIAEVMLVSFVERAQSETLVQFAHLHVCRFLNTIQLNAHIKLDRAERLVAQVCFWRRGLEVASFPCASERFAAIDIQQY